MRQRCRQEDFGIYGGQVAGVDDVSRYVRLMFFPPGAVWFFCLYHSIGGITACTLAWSSKSVNHKLKPDIALWGREGNEVGYSFLVDLPINIFISFPAINLLPN